MRRWLFENSVWVPPAIAEPTEQLGVLETLRTRVLCRATQSPTSGPRPGLCSSQGSCPRCGPAEVLEGPPQGQDCKNQTPIPFSTSTSTSEKHRCRHSSVTISVQEGRPDHKAGTETRDQQRCPVGNTPDRAVGGEGSKRSTDTLSLPQKYK